MHCGAAPAGWNKPELDDRDLERAPDLVEKRDSGAPVEADAVEAPSDGGVPSCSGPRFARWHFAVGAELPSRKTLTLRIRYTHGFAAYLNGVELARRRLIPPRRPTRSPTMSMGPSTSRSPCRAQPAPRRQRARRRGSSAPRRPRHHVELSLRGDEGARLVSGPYPVGLREHEARLVFETPLPTSAEVLWGRDDDYGGSAHDVFGTHHVIRLEGLKPGTVYHYRVRVRPSVSGDGELDAGDAVFHTPPDAGRPLRFASTASPLRPRRPRRAGPGAHRRAARLRHPHRRPRR